MVVFFGKMTLLIKMPPPHTRFGAKRLIYYEVRTTRKVAVLSVFSCLKEGKHLKGSKAEKNK